ncbi:TPA: type II restriction endonuclease [Campylobacter jejuni]|uniref:type II restriction endonuclease n=1 Tax=Campylobacter TaxID=194 RepID=UPI000F80C595|nr:MULTISPECIES: type II restriction endonuclease [Campylobacter]EAI3980343.1 type II restriction endonuclease [Campylobacter jejuni]EME0204914.1 type II restriction endonuclease [Campylobacter jejuni]RTI92322.1 type II restriction endonuclease [Campylobacter jejuni]HEF7996545.1 type II restriction endonuclease [Campylobacter jejuni]
MTHWTQQSIILANNYNYLDKLYSVYPVIPNIRRNLSQEVINNLNSMLLPAPNFNRGDLLKLLLNQEVFPIKDSYVAYLRRDKSAIERNPDTVTRIENTIVNMGLDEILREITRPIEANRQMGQLFKNWINSPFFRFEKTDNIDYFLKTDTLLIFMGSDNLMAQVAKDYFGYQKDKGIDFIAKKGKNVAIGEAKFLTDFGGHQNAQFNDAINILSFDAFAPCNYKIFPIAILDGVLYIQNTTRGIASTNKMANFINLSTTELIMSALLLGDFIVSL